MANTPSDSKNDVRENGPLHRPAATIDAGKSNTGGNESPVIRPASDEHLARPGIDAPIPTGQVSKM